MTKNKLTNIAELLPQNMSEEAVKKIAKLVEDTINDEVSKRFTLLEAKVKGFLRTNIEQIKEHALKELTEESETYRNAQLFEEVKSLMALEISAKDEASAVSKAVSENTDIAQENEVLVEELNNALLENKDLKRKIKVISAKAEKLISESKNLETKVADLTESNKLDFKSSEKAVIIADNVQNETPKKADPQNALLTEDIVALMPRKKK